MSRKTSLEDRSPKRSRRELLAGAAGAMGASLAMALARTSPACAGSDGDVRLGVDLEAVPHSTGVKTNGSVALAGYDDIGTGVFGSGSNGVGGNGTSVGVLGTANSPGVAGVQGIAYAKGSGDGVYGEIVQGHVKGVHGGTPDVNGYGVFGEHSGGGRGGRADQQRHPLVRRPGPERGERAGGVRVEHIRYWGVRGGQSAAGAVGVQGSTFSGTGVYAAVVGSNTTAAALRVSGPALFSRSGILSVPAGQSSSTATGVAMTKASLVLATPQQNRAGVDVQSAVSSVAGNSLTVYLNKPVTKTTKVAWFVVN